MKKHEFIKKIQSLILENVFDAKNIASELSDIYDKLTIVGGVKYEQKTC